MQHTSRRTAAILAGLLLFTGCSASVSVGGGDAVKTGDLETQVTKTIVEKTGNTPDRVTCPKELRAEVGATAACSVEGAEGKATARLKVTSVKDGKANFDVSVTSDPSENAPSGDSAEDGSGQSSSRTLTADRVAKQISDLLEQKTGQRPAAVTCPDEIDIADGTSTTCVLDDGPTQYEVTYQVSGVAGTDYHYDIQVADKPIN